MIFLRSGFLGNNFAFVDGYGNALNNAYKWNSIERFELQAKSPAEQTVQRKIF